jgi:hypothetical protein
MRRMPELQIGYHDHCFDGVSSAATFLRFYREKVKPGVRSVELKGLAHKPGQLFAEDVFTGEENAVVDFRYSPDQRLTWWFDHHQSAFETPGDRESFDADASGRKFWDPTAKSCTRFLARTVAKQFAWDPTPMAELIHWAEIIDGALFPNPQMAVQLHDRPMQLMLLLEASKDPQLCPSVALALAEKTLSEVLDSDLVQGPLDPILAKHHQIVALVKSRIELRKGVATFDLADTGVDAVNKFIAYDKDPATLYTVSVTKGGARCKISLGSSPWRQADRTHNLAQIAERYGGGGHPAVAAISFAPDKLQDARDAAASIAGELRGESQ